MATRVAGATGTTSVTMPSHQAGDLLVAFAFRDGSTSAPTVPAGWNAVNASGANTCWGGLYYKIAASGSETSGTWTSASRLSVVSYRPSTDKALGVGSYASGSGASASVDYNALTMAVADGSSWVAGVAGHRSVNTALETAPTGMTNVAAASGVDATAEIAWHDTNGPVSGWSTQSVSVGGTSSGWRSYAFEIVEATTWSPWDKASGLTLSNGNLQTTNSGAASPRVNRATLSRNSGKFVVAFDVTTYATGDDIAIGLATAAHSLTTRIEETSEAWRWSPDGAIESNNAGVSTAATWVGGDRLFIAADRDANRCWCGKWNGSSVTWSGSPDAGTGGFTVASLSGDALFPVGAFWNVDGALTIDGTASGHGLSTFSAWDGPSGPTYTLDVVGASLALTSPAVGLKAGRQITAQGRVLSLTGQAVTLSLTRKLNAASASLSLTSPDVELIYVPISGYTLDAEGAVFDLSGEAVGLKVSRRLVAFGRTMTLAAGDASLGVSRKLLAGGATLALTSPNVTIRLAKTLFADGVALTLSADAVGLTVGRSIDAEGALVALQPGDVELVWSGAPVWFPVTPTPETWSAQPNTVETWTPASATPEGWSGEAETSEDWTAATTTPETWH